MPLPPHIHILGASGSGTSTLARAIAARHGHVPLDTDDFYWLPTSPPYRAEQPVEERLRMLEEAMAGAPAWVLSGSLSGWGDPLVGRFDLVVFLRLDVSVRLERLWRREVERYGAEALAPGGEMHEAHAAFLAWAAGYDEGGREIRSRALHEAWLDRLPCPVVRLEGDHPVEERLRRLEIASGLALA